MAGSPAYVAPEVICGKYSEKVDVWGAGVLLHLLLVGILPFKGGSLEAVFQAIKSSELDFASGPWENVSELARDLVRQMLRRDVAARINAENVLSKLILSLSHLPPLLFLSSIFVSLLSLYIYSAALASISWPPPFSHLFLVLCCLLCNLSSYSNIYIYIPSFHWSMTSLSLSLSLSLSPPSPPCTHTHTHARAHTHLSLPIHPFIHLIYPSL